MNIAIKGNLKDYINKKVEQGLYEDASDFVRDAIRKFEKSDPSFRDYQKRADTGVSEPSWSVLGDPNGVDIVGLAFIVLQQAAKSAQDDIKTIMEGIKRINQAKDALRNLSEIMGKDIAANSGKKKKHPPFDFSQGMGNEDAYHHTLMPVRDSKGEIEFIITDLFAGDIESIDDLETISDKIKNDLDSMSEMGEMESLRLQMMMDRLSKIMSTVSNLLKKLNDTAAAITQNMK